MKSTVLAKEAYSNASQTTRTDRGNEYHVIADVSRKLKESASAGARDPSKLVLALSENHKLWVALGVSVADHDNELPSDLRAKIFYLSEFVQKYTNDVLVRKAPIRPLLEVNAAVLKGLAGTMVE